MTKFIEITDAEKIAPYLSAYLPHGIKCFIIDGTFESISKLTGVCSDGSFSFKNNDDILEKFDSVKPLLRPIDDLEWSIFEDEMGGDMSDNIREFIKHHTNATNTNEEIFRVCPLPVYNWMLKNQFDIFDLIPKGLALSVHDLK